MSDSSEAAESKRRWPIWFGGIALVLGLVLFIVTHIDTPAPYVEWRIPENPVAKAAYDYAHSIKLPDSAAKPVPFKFCRYNALGLCLGKATRDEYFEHLCKTEAGEYVFRRVKGVSGMALLSPRRSTDTKTEAYDRYALEDPLTSATEKIYLPVDEETYGADYIQPPEGRYQTFEAYYWAEGRIKLLRYFRNELADPSGRRTSTTRDGKTIPWIVGYEQIDQFSERYGVALRGIRRDRDREFGIAGGEVIVLDRATREVLAMRRDFARSPDTKAIASGINWDNALTCLKAHENFSTRFVRAVLIP